MVVRRFLSVLYPAFEYEQTSLEAKAAGQTFAANGKTVISAGWKAVYEESMQEEDTEDNALKDQKLPVFRQGEKIHIDSVRLTNGKTKPPAHFTEATLLGKSGKIYVDERLTGGKDAGRDRRTWHCCHKSRYH